MTRRQLEELIATLAAARFTDWHGLPAEGPGGLPAEDRGGLPAEDRGGLPAELGLEAADLMPCGIGADDLDAALAHLPDLRPGCSARGWIRAGRFVLLEVAWSRDAPAWPAALGEPDERLDVVDGTVGIAAGEWVYAGRGLSVVTSPDSRHVRHAFGFTPTTAQRYTRDLRVRLATTRRPAGAIGGWGG